MTTRPTSNRCRRLPRLVAAVVSTSWTGAGTVTAQVVHDGTLGAAGPVAGPNFQIAPGRGRLAGPNLFHSFGTFNLAAGELATFTGPPAVANVLARVTGGAASNIDGTIRCTIPGANFYLVNPAGVVFGPGASLDVSGSFAVSTADVVRLADGGRFGAAAAPAASVLTTAPPAAFGFLGPRPAGAGAVVVSGGRLAVAGGRSLAVVGGDVRVDAGGRLLAPGGRVAIASLVAAGEVAFDPAGPGSAIDVPAGGRGDVAFTGGAVVDASGPAAGRVVVRAGGLRVADAAVTATTGDADGGDIDLGLTGPLDVGAGGFVATVAFGRGRGGDVVVSAGSISLDRTPAAADAGGAAGPDDAITAQGRETGSGGNVTLTAESVRVDAGRFVRTFTDAAGAAGTVRIAAADLDVTGGGQVLAQTFGPGAGGRVELDVSRRLAVTGLLSAVRANTGPGSTGAGGDVVVGTPAAPVPDVRVADGAVISVTTNGAGDAGTARFAADRIVLDGGGLTELTGIAANTQSDAGDAGGGGRIEIDARAPTILSGAGVSAKTFSRETGGDVLIRTTDLFRIDGRGGEAAAATGVNVEALTAGGGDIDIRAGRLEVVRGEITAAAAGDGGNIRLGADVGIAVVGGTVTAEARGGDGGRITLNPPTVLLDRSLINGLSQGRPVRVRIDTDNLLRSNTPILTDALDASPASDIAGALAVLSAGFQDAAARLQDLCGQRTGGAVSSFLVTGRGGEPPLPGGPRPDDLPAGLWLTPAPK